VPTSATPATHGAPFTLTELFTPRWCAPADTIRLAGPGARGENYIIGNGTLYCVSLK
jgi:hypothetical protein